MTDYPIGSTARVYCDMDGNDITLHQLIRQEPDWARSRIIVGEEALAEVERLTAALFRLGSCEAMTYSFAINKSTNEGRELDARLDYARDALKKPCILCADPNYPPYSRWVCNVPVRLYR